METVEIKVTVPKELNDVRVALISVIGDIKAGKNVIQAGIENLQKLQDAVVGVGNIPAELTADTKDSIVLGGLLGGEILAALIG